MNKDDVTARSEAPNVVMIVLDDLGYAQLGCYGSDIQTPAIDRLARNGLRYNRFHVTGLCSPTRACPYGSSNSPPKNLLRMALPSPHPMTLPPPHPANSSPKNLLRMPLPSPHPASSR